MGRDEAAQVALALANREWGFPRDGEELVILDRHVEESQGAWAFTYNTRSFAESGDIMRSLIGNGPVVVSKATGEPTLMPSAYSCQEALRVWQSRRPPGAEPPHGLSDSNKNKTDGPGIG